MTIEIIFLIIVFFISYHIYTDGKWITQFILYKKHFQIAGVIIISLFLYWLFKKNPLQAHKLILSSNEFVKYLPIDQNTSNIINPIIDFTNKWSSSSFSNNLNSGNKQSSITKITNSGNNNNFKRSVSESKKKYVAAQQDWCCNVCKEKLKATFEVDHIIPLYKGGTNHIDNLRALCVECHKLHTITDKL